MAEIHIDASRALDEKPTGVNVYAREVIACLAAQRPQDTFVLYAPHWLEHRISEVFGMLPENCRWKVLRWPPRYLWTQVRLAWEWWRAFSKNHDAHFFAPAHVAPLVTPPKTSVTIHDVAFNIVPEAYAPLERWFARIMTWCNAFVAHHIFVPSQVTKDDLVRVYGIEPSRITVTPLALPVASAASYAETSPRIKPYYLFVGRVEYKKGVDRLIAAFEAVEDDAELLIVGKPGVGYAGVQEQIAHSPARGRIVQLGYVESAELPNLYRHAIAYVLPSRYEGFGINVLEAMTHGAPVVAMRSGSIPEVAGDAGLLADSVEELAAHMKSVRSNVQLRAELIARGNERVKAFSWEKTVALMRFE